MLGFSIALAIAIHNIPEGISIAMPVYYATEAAGKPSGCPCFRPLRTSGAILAMLILGPLISDTLFGMVFCRCRGYDLYFHG